MGSLDSILKSRDITLPTKFHLVKAMVFPVVMYGCESESEVTQLYPALCNTMDYSLPGFSVHGIFQGRVPEWVAISFSRDLLDPEIEPWSPALQADALPSEPPGKPIWM